MKGKTPDPNGYKGLEHCPDFDERFTLANGTDKAIPYPQTGYNCTKDYAMLALDEMIQTKSETPDPNGYQGLEHCPDFDERFTLANGRDRAVPYPQTGYNCTKDYALLQTETDVQEPDPNGWRGLEHCPDFNERFTLTNGRDRAVPWPQTGYNCNPEFSLSQTENKKDPDDLEHCPDFDERFTLANGRDKAIPYPQPFYNCNANYSLNQSKSQKLVQVE